MPAKIAVKTIQMISHIWSSKRERNIAVLIAYQVRVQAGCKIYQLSRTVELE